MAGSILGNRVQRKEDPKFLTTGGVYVDDMLDEPLLAGALHVTYVRSTVAHANIISIDVASATGSTHGSSSPTQSTASMSSGITHSPARSSRRAARPHRTARS